MSTSTNTPDQDRAEFRIESFTDWLGRTRWRFAIIASNGRKLDPRQPYNTERAATEACEIIRGLGPETRIVYKGDAK